MGCGASANYKLTSTQQLRLETQKGVEVKRGPQLVYLSTWSPPLKEEVQDIVSLEAHEYAIIRDTNKTILRTEAGEQRFFLLGHEELVRKDEATCLSQTEYCYVDDGGGKRRLVRGPMRLIPGPYEQVGAKQDAVTLDSNMYIKIRDKVAGQVRVERGPKLVFPEPSDEIINGGRQHAVKVDAETAVLVRDSLLGNLFLVQDAGLFFPRAQDDIVSVQNRDSMVKLEAHQWAVIRDTQKNELRVEEGEQRFFLNVNEELVRRGDAVRLSPTEYCYVIDGHGKQRIVRGPMRYVPGPFEDATRKKQAITLDSNMYVKLQGKATGTVWVECGPKLIFPEPTEQVVGGGPQKAVEVDSETAVLVRDSLQGGLRLVQDHGLFFPRAEDDIVSVQKLIRLSDHDALVMKDETGAFQYFYGNDALRGDQPRAFFLPPYCEIVEHCWSRGRRRQTRDLRITHLDMRPQFMNFEFNSRTSDNVELVLEGTFYWQLVDVPKMMIYSGDVTGDICNYARSTFIQKISQVTLKEFMDGFRTIANQVIQEDGSFYETRGLKVHSLEVTGYHCADSSTAAILQQMIQETTNRMNRTSQQESEDELSMKKIQSKIEHHRVKGELLRIQQEHLEAGASSAGNADAQRASHFLKSLEEVVPNCEDRVEMWKILRKGEALQTVSAGKAHLYFTPSDVNLSIEDRNGR
eukprot:TRINITY_DN19478_c0_g1_i4.p1 TRINITY_DN19478_c0_g1~~TRINITY_DN19478_c0_g1_i4.p1  ORF type:complete len:690 (-),score=140.54 TRINITY_DN19478_c0_g1_i4:197-2266(-)